MSWLVRTMALAAILAASLGVQSAQAQTPTAGRIFNSPHDLSSGLATNADKNEVCVYCHTPHSGDNTAPVPLWNKALPAGTSFTTYDSLNSATIDGDFLTVGSVSVACLSCHDGTQAVDAVINTPGTGGNIAPATSPLFGLASPGPLTSFANLTSDLSDDHPISIQYAGFNPGTGQIDPDFITPSTAVINATTVWWVETGANTTREKTDMILYTRDNAGTPEPFVECGSCHDPHAGAAADVTAGDNAIGSDISFMRISNENSAVCLACHIK